MEEKKELRKCIQLKRDRIPPGRRERFSMKIAKKFLSSEEYKNAENILIFYPFRSEINTVSVIEKAVSDGKNIILPKVSGKNLKLFFINDTGSQLRPGAYGIPEPCKNCPPAKISDIDLAVIPGVCFDSNFNRLGYGGGFYDKILPLLPDKVRKIALCFQLQVVEGVPVEGHDMTVDKIITEKRIYSRY